MFKLLNLKLEDHPQLGNLEISFVEESESATQEKPYTTVIIGPNGSGKSYILKTIADIFRQLKNLLESGKKEFSLPFGIHLRYRFYLNIYEVVTHRLKSYGRTGERRTYLYFKNRPIDKLIFQKDSPQVLITGFEIIPEELELPEKLVVSSIMLNDRFTFAVSVPTDFYQYLGVRRAPSVSSTRTFARKTIRYLFDASKAPNFIDDLGNILEFLGFERFLQIWYVTRYNDLFFSGDIDKAEFVKFFEKWWESKYTKREESSIPFSKHHYDNIIKKDPKRIDWIIEYLNAISKNENKILHKPKSHAKFLQLDLFVGEQLQMFRSSIELTEYDLIEDLIKLDIINLNEIKIRKKGTDLSLEQVSSGEYHLIISLLGLYSKIEKDSIILIDEPEISLHPNWQMQYVTFLKKMFYKFKECHFILTTHSHFLVSDLEGDTSAVVAIEREKGTSNLKAKLLEHIDTFGWSAEQVLFEVFKVPTTRNYYISDKVGEILELVSKEKRDENKIREKVRELALRNIINLSDDDPLKPAINKLIEKYG